MRRYKSYSDMEGELKAKSIVDPIIYLKTNDSRYQNDEWLINLIRNVLGTNSVQQRLSMILECYNVFLSRPKMHFNNISDIGSFFPVFLELMQRREEFYDLLDIFLNCFVLNKYFDMDLVVHLGVIPFLIESMEDSSMEECSAILCILSNIAKRDQRFVDDIFPRLDFDILHRLIERGDLLYDVSCYLIIISIFKQSLESYVQIASMALHLIKQDLQSSYEIYNPSEINSLIKVLIFTSAHIPDFYDMICSQEIFPFINYVLKNEYTGETLEYCLYLIINIIKSYLNKTSNIKDPFDLFKGTNEKPEIEIIFETIPRLIRVTGHHVSHSGEVIPCLASKIITFIIKMEIPSKINDRIIEESIIPTMIYSVTDGSLILRTYALKAFRVIFSKSSPAIKQQILNIPAAQLCFEVLETDESHLILASLNFFMQVLDYSISTESMNLIKNCMNTEIENRIDEFMQSSNTRISEVAAYIKEQISLGEE